MLVVLADARQHCVWHAVPKMAGCGSMLQLIIGTYLAIYGELGHVDLVL